MPNVDNQEVKNNLEMENENHENLLE